MRIKNSKKMRQTKEQQQQQQQQQTGSCGNDDGEYDPFHRHSIESIFQSSGNSNPLSPLRLLPTHSALNNQKSPTESPCSTTSSEVSPFQAVNPMAPPPPPSALASSSNIGSIIHQNSTTTNNNIATVASPPRSETRSETRSSLVSNSTTTRSSIQTGSLVDFAAFSEVNNVTVINSYRRTSSRTRTINLNSTATPSMVRIAASFQADKWKKGVLIGTGAFGTVHTALNEETGMLMAMKSITFDTADKDLDQKLISLQNEIAILKKLDHDHIVKYCSSARSGTAVNIFMEYVPGGSIKDVINNFGALSEATVVQYTYQIVLGLEYLHRNH
eukprot:PhM_4_TR3452/c2_g1_i2/m.62871